MPFITPITRALINEGLVYQLVCYWY